MKASIWTEELVLGWGGGKLWSVTCEKVRGDESRRISSEEGGSYAGPRARAKQYTPR